MSIPKWRIEMDYIESCNCDFGCPCNFNGYPTDDYCHTMVGYHIRAGHYGDTDLAGLQLVMAATWPGAIHQGNGTVRLHVDHAATEAQRSAVMAIFSGKAKGNGPFELFAETFSHVEKPLFTDVQVHADGRQSWFRVADIIDVQLDAFVNPVSGEPQDIQIHMPSGFIFKYALAARTKVMRLLGLGALSFDHSGKNGFFAEVEYAGP